MQYKDHFSRQAPEYARYRPGYPRELFQFLASRTPKPRLAWDCATGNGQAALGLANDFHRVVATDASTRQLSQAKRHPKVDYLQAVAEEPPLKSASVDLTTIAQALHWFDWKRFYPEVRRVSVPGALIAAWTYSRLEGPPSLNAVLEEFYREKVGDYWPPERRFVEDGYANLPFTSNQSRRPSSRSE